jgi:ribose transport system ATP-binding protein
MEDTILSIKAITKRYPGVVALDNVSIDFKKGEVHALLGENGAGKSTLIKAIAGAIQADAGEIIINGKAYTHLTPHMAKSEGVEVIYQEFNLMESLSIAENICFGEKTGKLVSYTAMERKAKAIFDLMGVSLDLKALVRNLPSSQKQLVEIGKSVSRNAKILIMDEPSAPLSVSEIDKMFDIVRKLKANGVTIIYISHRMEEIFEIADRVTVLRDGKFIATKPIAETSIKDLIALMVGRELNQTYPPKQAPLGNTVLEVKHLYGNGDEDISFSLRSGEILGLAGLVGCGRTELVRVIFGADPIVKGEILVHGKKVSIRLPKDAIDHGIGLIPEDRKLQGCFLEKPIRWNISIANIRALSKRTLIDPKREVQQASEYKERLNIKTPSLEQMTKNLSGGNQQKVVLAKTLATQSEILIFDEPTRGIDVGAKHEIYQLMIELAAQGKAILMITSDMPELLGMSDRIIILHEGKISGELNKADFSQDRILELASGLH